MKFVFIGIQGSGKGTQGRILEREYGFKLYETGGALREMAKKDTELGKLVKETMESGQMVSPKIVEDIIEDIVKTTPAENIIFDGFVRNAGNKESMDRIIGDYQVIYFNLPKEEAITRLTTRMYDPETGETFPAGTQTNPENGNILEQRKDDNEEAILKRIEWFFTDNMPLIEEYKKAGKLIEIDANQSIEMVTNEILTKLSLK